MREHSPTRRMLDAAVAATGRLDQAEQALAIAREVDDPACCSGRSPPAGHRRHRRRGGAAVPRRGDRPGPRLGDKWRLSQILCGRPTRRSWRATRARRARPPRKAAISPTDRRPVRLAVCRFWGLGCGTVDAGSARAASRNSARCCRGRAAHDPLWTGRRPVQPRLMPWHTRVTRAARASRGQRGRRSRSRVRRILRGLALLAIGGSGPRRR